jgi:hypothetical protein
MLLVFRSSMIVALPGVRHNNPILFDAEKTNGKHPNERYNCSDIHKQCLRMKLNAVELQELRAGIYLERTTSGGTRKGRPPQNLSTGHIVQSCYFNI